MYSPPVTYDTWILQNRQCIALCVIRYFAFCTKSVSTHFDGTLNLRNIPNPLGLYSILVGNSQSFIVFFMAFVKTEMLCFLK